jgi:signal transduction histidine kinase
MPTSDGSAPSPLRTAAQAALLGVVYFGAVNLATAISIPNVSIAPIRLPNAFAITALLLTPPSTWWIYLLAIVPRNLWGFPDWTIGARYLLANSTEIVIAAAAVRRIAGSRPRLERLSETLIFVAAAVIVAPMLAGLIGASAVHDIYPTIPAVVSWRVWFLGDAVGNVAIVPALLALAGLRTWRDTHVSVNVWRIAEGVAIGTGIIVGSLPTLGALGANGSGGATALSMLYVPFPLLVWSALRFGPGGAAAANVLLSTLAVMAALQRSGPFAQIDNPSGVLILQQFLLVAGATAVILAAAAVERRRSEAERIKLEEQMAQVRKLEAVGQLAGGIAHDFNNILQAILGFADLARESVPPDSPTADHLDKVITSAERAQTLTRQLLTFSRREKVTPRVLDVLVVIGEFNRILRRMLPASIQLSLTGRAGAPLVVADRSHVEQIVMNLCVNAADAMPGGGTIAVTVDREDVTPSFAAAHASARAGEFVTIAVADTGSGITADHLPHIFEPFFTTKEVGKGTGLGLATVYAIAQRYQGLIDVQSTPGRGSTFRVYLPAQAGSAVDEERSEVPVAALGKDELILVAEDEPLVRELAVSQLKNAGYRVLEAADGETAINLFNANAADIRLAFLDLMMPRGDGRSVRLAIRAKQPTLPILFTTGYAESNGSVELGDRMLLKPYSTAALLSTIRELLDQRPV